MRSGNYTTGQQWDARVLYDELGRAIEARRLARDWSRAELARRSGESVRVIQAAEEGRGMPLRALFALADALGCTVDALRSA